MLVTTLTKKMAEDLTDYLLEQGVRVRYLHSNVDTIQRIEILRDLRLGEFDVLVGINLLREGLDLPEVSLVAILDADKEGFLRSRDVADPDDGPGRPQRRRPGDHVRRQGHRLDAAGHLRDATAAASSSRRYNEEHGIDPQTIRKAVTDILAMLRPAEDGARCPGKDRRSPAARPVARGPGRAAAATSCAASSSPSRRRCTTPSTELRFEYAARLRDEIKDLKRELRDVG